VTGAVFSPDGLRLAAWDDSGAVHLWDSSTGQELATWQTDSRDGRQGALFSIDGHWLVIRSTQGVRFWPVDPLAEANRRRPRELTTAEREQFELQ